MTRGEKILLVITLVGLILLSGAAYQAEYCFRNMTLSAVAGPRAVLAAEGQYTCGMHPMIVVDEPGTCPICGMDLTPLKSETGGAQKPKGERKIKYWVAPMDPSYIRDEPGKSPMGMDLVPVYEGEAATGSVITIDPVTAQNMGVRTAVAERRDISRPIRTVGLVAYEEPRQYSVNTKIAGWVERLYVDQTGEHIKRGEPLLEIYSPELVSAQEEFLLALNNRDALANSAFPQIAAGAKRLYASAKQRLKLWDISDSQIARLEKTRKVRRNLTLFAPYGGIVTMKMVNEGMYVKPGMELFQIADISKVWVNADIYEYELPWVQVGQDAEVILPFAGGRELDAQVSFIYPYVEPRTRTVKARLELPNPDLELKPDMYVNVRIHTDPVKNALAIPGEAVLRSGEEETVFVALEGGKFEPRRVKVGVTGDDGYVQVEEGVFEGERVVTSAQFMLDSESQLREAVRKMLEPKATAAPEPAEEDVMEDLFGEEEEGAKKEGLDDLF